MTLRTGSKPTDGADRHGRGRGFTLIELILVMALLVIVIGVALPSLKGFFRGRGLDNEARRFLSLTRYGQSRAVAEGVPMVLWVDANAGFYGLEMAAGYEETDPQALEFELDPNIAVEGLPPRTISRNGTLVQVQPAEPNALEIWFHPDGFIGMSSPEGFLLQDEGADEAVWLVQSTNRLRYEISEEAPVRRQR